MMFWFVFFQQAPRALHLLLLVLCGTRVQWKDNYVFEFASQIAVVSADRDNWLYEGERVLRIENPEYVRGLRIEDAAYSWMSSMIYTESEQFSGILQGHFVHVYQILIHDFRSNHGRVSCYKRRTRCNCWLFCIYILQGKVALSFENQFGGCSAIESLHSHQVYCLVLPILSNSSLLEHWHLLLLQVFHWNLPVNWLT